jgi:hypothetical protein
MSTSNREVKVDGEEQASGPASGEIVALLERASAQDSPFMRDI